MPLTKASKHKTLPPEDLKCSCDPDFFDFDDTDGIDPIEGIVGQERALKALKIGVDIRSRGYNIFITGLSGTGKQTTVKQMLESISPECPQLYDYAYVNNFDLPDNPTLLTFNAGRGAEFKKDIESAIKFLRESIPIILENEPFATQKKKLISKIADKQHALFQAFEKKIKKDHFALGQVKVGEALRPELLYMVGDKAVFIQNLDELVEEKKISEKEVGEINEKYESYQDELQTIFKKNLESTQDLQERVEKLEKSSVKNIVDITFSDVKEKYDDEKINKYLIKMSENILTDLALFKNPAQQNEEDESKEFLDYQVNLLLNNENTKDCPVIIETSPNFSNLFGVIEKYSDGNGGWYADFTRIKCGSLLRANGGYLVMNAMDAFSEYGVWKHLKRVLLYGKLEIQDIQSLYNYHPSILKPEPIHITTKIILIGNNNIYSLLANNEDDFNKIFKIKADFDYEMDRTEKAMEQYAKVVKSLIEKEKLLPLDKSGIIKVLEYGARYAGNKNKLTTRFAYIADLVREASFWAADVGDKIIGSYHVKQAYESAQERHGLTESKLSEMMKENVILIDTDGERIGQINGLAVYGNGNFSFGKPTRITATVALGNGRIINVERESGLSGNTHNKGMLILTGYFREKFGTKIPLSFTASLVFEQGYSHVDGDSASITEVCALLSTLAQVPIKQCFAITGSVNQKGDVQPIGGVNEKVEGFFDLCKARGLTGEHGVIIPYQNINDLMLNDEIVEAVEKKQFHIYPVERVEEAIEILTGFKAGKLLKNGKYAANTIFGSIEKNLIDMRKRIKPSMTKRKTTGKK